jgi:hypothetical protein
MENQKPDKREITEVPQKDTPQDGLSLEYDYVIGEAAVGEIKGVHFTTAGITWEEKEGKSKATTYLDIEKSRFEDIYEGSIVKLNEQIKVLVTKIETSPEPQGKGRIYFKLM